VRGIGVIEGLAIDVLGVRRQVALHGGGQIEIVTIWHVATFPLAVSCRRKIGPMADLLLALNQ
jgi:hypothetical protein